MATIFAISLTLGNVAFYVRLFAIEDNGIRRVLWLKFQEKYLALRRPFKALRNSLMAIGHDGLCALHMTDGRLLDVGGVAVGVSRVAIGHGAALMTLTIDLNASQVLIAWYVESGIEGEKVGWADMELVFLGRHDGPVFGARVMCKAKHAPHDYVSVFDVVVACDSVSDTVYLDPRLVGKFTTCPELAIAVRRDPHMVLSK